MPFTPGDPNINRKGRPKLEDSVVTQATRETFLFLLKDNFDNLKHWLDAIAKKDPEKAFKLILEVSEYILPKLARTTIEGDKDNPITWQLVNYAKPGEDDPV